MQDKEQISKAIHSYITNAVNKLRNEKYPALTYEAVKDIYLSAFKDALDLSLKSVEAFEFLQGVRRLPFPDQDIFGMDFSLEVPGTVKAVWDKNAKQWVETFEENAKNWKEHNRKR